MPSITSGYLQRVVRCKWRAFYASPATSSTTNIKHLQQNPNRVRAQKNRLKDGLFVESGAGNGTSTDALSVCFPTLFFAEGLNEGLNFSLVFGRRQRRPSTNFHSPPTPSAHLRATPCRGSPLHRVRVRELSAHLSALHS